MKIIIEGPDSPNPMMDYRWFSVAGSKEFDLVRNIFKSIGYVEDPFSGGYADMACHWSGLEQVIPVAKVLGIDVVFVDRDDPIWLANIEENHCDPYEVVDSGWLHELKSNGIDYYDKSKENGNNDIY